ncbi:MAG TPA: PilN domain-containing protein [Chloroflexota bacterium]|nr:PilN domain-containing protein [Chloroflexota bacterium]
MDEILVIGLQLHGSTLREARVRRAARGIEVALRAMPLSQPAHTTNGALRLACLPAPTVISRCWEFPKADEQTIRQMVANRLEAEIPVPVDKLAWDCRCHRQTSNGTASVLVQAARADLVARQMMTLVDAGHGINILTTEAEAVQALYRYGLKRPGTNGTEAVILAEATGWLVAMLTDGAVRAIRRLGAHARVEAVARECRQALESQDYGRTVQRVWWVAKSEMTAAMMCLTEQLKVPVEPARPAQNLVAGQGNIQADDLADYGIPIGLALAGLLEADEVMSLAGQRETRTSPRRQWIGKILAKPVHLAATAGVLTLLAAVLHVGAMSLEARKMHAVLAEADAAAVAGKDFQPKLQAMQRLQAYRVDIEKVFSELGQVMPDNIVVSTAQFSRESRMIIKGTAKDPKAVFTLAEALRKSKRFRDVNWDRAEPGQGGTFIISMEVAGMTSLNPQRQGGVKWR